MAKENPAKEQAAKDKRRWRVSRRGFLIGLGVVGGGLALGWRFGLPAARLGIANSLEEGGAPGGAEVSPDLWFEVNPDNTVSLYLMKVEMGQGVHTALAQLAAEELELPFENLQVIPASTARGIEDGFGTGGSTTISSLFTPLREGAATLRLMLQAKAAEKWSVEPDNLVAMNGSFFKQANPEETMTYAEAAQGVSDWEIPKDKPELKGIREFAVIGQPMKRVDFTEKLTGRAVYGYDARVDGMLYGAVARPPRFTATLKQASEGTARAVKGVVDVVIEDDFAGVVATSRGAAYRGLEALELDWDLGETYQQADIDALTQVRPGEGVVVQKEGRVAAKLKSATSIRAEYHSPMAAHAHLEPQAALVEVRSDRVIAQVSTQSPQLVRDEIAEALKRKKEDVEVTATYLGGGFGRRLNVEVAVEAARLSQAIGKPVHIGWNRSEEFRHGYVRPPTHSVLEAALDKTGKIQAIRHELASGDVAFPFLPAFLSTIFGADFGAWRGGRFHYEGIENREVLSQRVKLPLKTGWWRGLGLLANTFAIESFMDELAHASGQDALEFRLRHLSASDHNQRLKRVLESAAEAAAWGTTLAEGRAHGIACSTDTKTVCAQVAEVSIEESKVRVHKITTAIDPGLIVNPDGVKAQTQGAIVFGLSSTFFEKLTIQDSQFAPQNFDTYPLITMKETPEIEVILHQSGEEPFGMGEPPLGPVAAAVANAVFALTGQRLRSLPLTLS